MTDVKDRKPAWLEIEQLFQRHGAPPPPYQLRDELVMHLLSHRADPSQAESFRP